jgi:glycosyltransferase involved in cell wall biosynthesis
MKIAIGTSFYRFGGVMQHIYGIRKYSTHDISVIPCDLAGAVLENNRIPYALLLYQTFVKNFRLGRYNILHSHPDTWFINLCQSARSAKCKWIHTYHTLYFEEDNPFGLQTDQIEMNRCLIDIASKADVAISVSKWLHDYLLKTYSIKTEIVPNGVDLDYCDKADPNSFSKKFGLRDFVLFIGYLDPIKNPSLFIELANRMPRVKFVMIGRNLSAIKIASNLKVKIPKNLFLLEEMAHNNVIDALSLCKAYVMTSKREGFPTSLLEAMGLGKAVVVPNHTGCKEIVASDDYGFLYQPDSIDDLVEKTRNALSNKNIGEKARERVLRNFDWKIVAKRLDSIYESS